jgi:hypothetical protein
MPVCAVGAVALMAVPKLLVAACGSSVTSGSKGTAQQPARPPPKATDLPPRAEHVNLITARWNQPVSAVHRRAIGDEPWA